MIDLQRQAYLEAMGFDVWVEKPPEPERDRLVLGAGESSTLLLCGSREDCDSPLAGDVERAIGGAPVWAWPDPDGRAEQPKLAEAVEQRLFTRVVLFGESLAERLLGQDIPAVLGSASVQVTVPLRELAVNGSAKQRFWRSLNGSGEENLPT